jgi:hypothetical protein
MPITTTVDYDRDLTIFTVTGNPHIDEGITTLIEFYQSKPSKNVLWDFSKGSLAHVTFDELRNTVEYAIPHTKKRTGGKTIFVAPRAFEYGTIKVLKTFGEITRLSVQLAVFRSIKEANKWLDKED